MPINLSLFYWAIAFFAAFILGLSKAGIKGPSVAYAVLLALVFGGRASTGILMPLLLVGDLFAIIYYRKHVIWKYLFRLLLWMIIGVVIAVVAGKDIEEEFFKKVMAATIFLSVVLMFWWSLQRKNKPIPNHSAFGALMGLSGGFSSMIAGVGGVFSNLYFIAMRLPKNDFIGTISCLFLLINCFKVPFHIFVWKTITPESLTIDIYLLTAEILGLFIGVRIVGKIKEKHYRFFILGLSLIAALFLFF